MPDILYEEIRGGMVENVHFGRICVVDERGRVRYRCGETAAMTYYRSASKPLQALPTLAMGLCAKYGFTGAETALMAASHMGEPYHVCAVLSMLLKSGLSEEDFVMNAAYPQNLAAHEAALLAGAAPRRAMHNCSGKHVALLLLARELSEDYKSYYKIENAAQAAVLSAMAALSGWPEEKIGIGIDGCGVPVFAVPLKNMALSFLRLACPDTIKDERLAGAAAEMFAAVKAHPEMIRGTGELDSVLNADQNLISKSGKYGVYCIGLRKERLGISLKVEDGAEEHIALLAAEVLRQIGYENRETIASIESLNSGIITNDTNMNVGKIVTRFELSGGNSLF